MIKMDEEWVPLDNWWLMIKMGSKSRSFMKKFEKELVKQTEKDKAIFVFDEKESYLVRKNNE